MRKILTSTIIGVLTLSTVVSCGGSAGSTAGSTDGNTDGPTGGPATVVVTTNMLGDIVTQALGDMVGDTVRVEVIMPVGADPHEFMPSARQAETMENADVLVVNGLGAEGAMADIVANVRDSGTPVFTVTDSIESELIANDPHVWLDPRLMTAALGGFAALLTSTTDLDPADVNRNVEAYSSELRMLDTAIETTLAAIPAERRLLVTNHDSLAYFARRYGFEVIGTIIPSVDTSAEPSASGLEELAKLIGDLGVPAVFAETTEPSRLADALADQVGGGVEVVELFTGSLGPAGSGAETYRGAMTVDADRIAAALR